MYLTTNVQTCLFIPCHLSTKIKSHVSLDYKWPKLSTTDWSYCTYRFTTNSQTVPCLQKPKGTYYLTSNTIYSATCQHKLISLWCRHSLCLFIGNDEQVAILADLFYWSWPIHENAYFVTLCGYEGCDYCRKNELPG